MNCLCMPQAKQKAQKLLSVDAPPCVLVALQAPTIHIATTQEVTDVWTAPLGVLVLAGRPEVFDHPVVEKLLEVKWNRFGYAKLARHLSGMHV